MKKILMLTMCLALIPMLFAGKATFEPETSTATEQLQRDQSQPVTDMAPMRPRPFTPARGETLYYGDGTFNGSLGITGAGTVPGPDETFGFATYFVLSDFGITDPRKVGTILLQFGVLNGTDYRLYIWDDAGTVPNSHGTHLYVDMAVPLPAPNVWQEIDLSALNIVLPDSFWIGIIYNYMSAGSPSDWYLAYNSAIADPHIYGNLGGGSGDWVPMSNYGYGYAFGVRVVVEEVGAPVLTFDFEDGWQGWTHTNGEVFPAAWGVQPSGIHTPCPNPGDSSMWIDSDASGGGYSDSALSPLLIPNPTMDWLKYGYYNYGGGSGYENELRVGIKYFTGGVWSVVELAYYPAGATSGPAWDSVDVSAYATADQIQIYFYHDDLGTWGYYSAFDNVSIDAHYPPTGPIVWDFETGWQGWIHTSALTFPAAWDVMPSGYKPAYTPPDAGDSTLWIDSDAAGSSGPWIQDTAISPAVVPNFAWLRWGIGYYHLGSQFMDVGIKYFDGTTWTAVPLRTYNATFGPAWDSVDISAYNGYDSIQVYGYFDDNDGWYWYAAFDNVGLYPPASHDVGCSEVVSPPVGGVSAADYDVIGRIQNFGDNIETFDVTANVFDTVGMTLVFTQIVTLTDFPVAGDSNVNFGTVTFAQDSVYYTEIYTQLVGDVNPLNDTSAILSWTGIAPGEIIFELDAEAITGDIRLLGVEFDGEYFYCTGASDYTQTWVYVIDTAGTLMHSYIQPAHSTGWGWRDIAWDYVYRGPDRIDTLYSSVDGNVDKWGYDFVGDSIIYYGYFDGPESPNRALAYDGDDDWFFTASFSNPLYKFNKDTLIIQTVPNPGYAMYGAAYDAGHAGPPTIGPWLWWHSQDDPGTGFDLQIEQMDPNTMVFTGVILAPVPTMSTDGTAGGLCYWSDFRGMDVLFGMNQGTPDHIFGVYLRMTPTGIEEMPGVGTPLVFGFAPNMANPIRGHTAIVYTTTTPSKVSLKVYDTAGRLVRTLVNAQQPAGMKNIIWNAKDDNHRAVANGIYFIRLEAEENTATHKLVLVK